ncbi:DUF6668 family protein [Streptomyces sp. NPDC002755]|uniref:DUF6668 family protein n=1 Tax=Streptomyces sp. NPDC002884 TaxID=3154544 RepID=UPI0033198024
MSGSEVQPPSDLWIRGPVSARQPTTARPFERPPQDPPNLAEQTAPQPLGWPAPDAAARAPGPAPQEPPAVVQEAPVTTVLSVPAAIVQAPPTAPRQRSSSSPAGISWVGAHGGAGASTFAAALGGVDVGHAWPDISQDEPGDMLLLARTHLAGLQAASQALDSLRTGRHPAGLQLLALVLVADAPGRLPPELWRRVRVLRAAVRTFNIPWIAQWRVGRPAPKAPRAVVDLAALIPPNSRNTDRIGDSVRPDSLSRSEPPNTSASHAPKDGS